MRSASLKFVLTVLICATFVSILTYGWINKKTRYKFAESFQTYSMDTSNEYAPLVEAYILEMLKDEIRRDPNNWKVNFEQHTQYLSRHHARITDANNHLIAYFGLKFTEADKNREANSVKKEIDDSATLTDGPYYLDLIRLEADEIDKIVNDMSNERFAPLSTFDAFINNANIYYITLIGIIYIIVVSAIFIYGVIANAFTSAIDKVVMQFDRIYHFEFVSIDKLDLELNGLEKVLVGKQLLKMFNSYNERIYPIISSLGFTQILHREIVTNYLALTVHELIRLGNKRAALMLQQDRHDTKRKYYNKELGCKQAVKGKTDRLLDILNAWPKSNVDVIPLVEKWVEDYQMACVGREMPELVLVGREMWPTSFQCTCCEEFFDLITEKLVQNTVSAYTANSDEMGKIFLKLKITTVKGKSQKRLKLIFMDHAGGVSASVIGILYKERLNRDENSFSEGIGAYLAGWLTRIQGWSIRGKNIRYQDGSLGLATMIMIGGNGDEQQSLKF